jgi:hypothetical protein
MLVGCGTTNVELLAPRDEVVSPVVPTVPDPDPPPEDPDPSVPDAGPAAEDAGSAACPAGALVCEGFETTLTGWTFVRSDGTAAATTLDSHSGDGSLELSTGSQGAFAYLERLLTPVGSGSLYLRAFVKVPSDQVVDGYDVVILSNAEADEGVATSLQGERLSLSILGASVTVSGARTFPRDEWVCLELALSLAATSTFTAGLDGTLDATLSDARVPSGGYSRMAIGVVSALPTQPPTRVLLDDLVIAASPVGCGSLLQQRARTPSNALP